MVYKAPLEKEVFWILYKKCYTFYNTTLMAFIVTKQGETLKFVSLIPNILIYFAKMSSYFSMKTNKRKLRKRLKGN